MVDVFSLNNRGSRVPEAKRTIQELSKLTAYTEVSMLNTPLIIMSSTVSNDILYEAPYFSGPKTEFKEKLVKKLSQERTKNICFFIIVNYFGTMTVGNQTFPKFHSHGMVGVIKPDNNFYVFDPNGDITTPESVYGSRAFNTVEGRVINPLYKVVGQYIKNEIEIDESKLRCYTGDYIPCSAISESCMYRSFMFILGLTKTSNVGEATQLTMEYSTSLEKANLINSIIKLVFGMETQKARELLRRI